MSTANVSDKDPTQPAGETPAPAQSAAAATGTVQAAQGVTGAATTMGAVAQGGGQAVATVASAAAVGVVTQVVVAAAGSGAVSGAEAGIAGALAGAAAGALGGLMSGGGTLPSTGTTPGTAAGTVPGGAGGGPAGGGAVAGVPAAIPGIFPGVVGGSSPAAAGAAAGIPNAGPAVVKAIAGAVTGGIAGGVVNPTAGAAEAIAGAVGGIAVSPTAGASKAIAGAVGGIAVSPTAGASRAIAGAVTAATGVLTGAASGAISAIAGAVGAPGPGIVGAAGGIPDGVPGALPGGISAVAGTGLQGIAAEPEMPVFPDIAVTAGPLVDQARDLLADASDAAGIVVDSLHGKNLEIEIASGDALDVRNFSIHERVSSLFQIQVLAVSENPSIDFDAVVGKDARFVVHAGLQDRSWSGLCNHIEQVRVEPGGHSTYQISIVPTLWLLTQRKNYRMFQQISEPDIVLRILKEWEIEPDVRIDRAAYKKRKYRVQYAESDFAFLGRMLEDAGISYYFEQSDDQTRLVLSDAPHTNPKRRRPLSFVDDTSMLKKNDHQTVTAVRMSQRVRPGKVTLRDHDYRRPPSYKLMTTASGGRDVESKLERYHYTPGAFLFGAEQGDATPVADDRGKTRTDEKEGAALAQKRLDAKRGSARVCTFETNAHDLAPGMVVTIANHPHDALAEGKKLLVVESSLAGTATGDWSHHCEARSTDVPFRPELATPRPKVNGVESATVVGPPGEEIHTDEFGRVRVHFHWDRESKMDHGSSCWIHVSQPWGGSGYGGINLPRVGQEVLVDFLGGDPDRPIIVGRVYTNLQKVPYKLPQDKTKSGWRSNSTGGGGGYNEIMFEDAQGKELVNIQAQRDLTELVKHDARHTVKNDRTTTVWNDNSQLVGKQHSLTIASSVTAEGPQPGPTKVTMVHERIELTTGKASIILEGPNITFKADQDISATALFNLALFSAFSNINVSAAVGQVSVLGVAGVGVTSPSQVKIDGASGVRINCTENPPSPIESGSSWFSMAAIAILHPPLFATIYGAQMAYNTISRLF